MSPPGVLLVATRSAHKLGELKELIGLPGTELLSLDEAGILEDPIEADLEVYDTFLENARAKAIYFQRATRMATIADDSGLCVDALQGGPGVRTKRFAPEDMARRYGRDEANNRFLLQKLSGIPPDGRGAHYRCAIAYEDGQESFAVEGRVDGLISDEARGSGGFGYDPLFILPEHGRTFGELPPDVKAGISHRARAAREFAKRFEEAL
jgi:XTP/dITP diphosphohydrolase